MLNTILRGHYKIITHLGGGGFGQTYLAEDIDLPTHPICVVKQLKPISHEPFVLETAKRLFDQEAEILYSLGSHDRIPRLLAHFQEGDEFYLVQEFADGTDLTQEIGKGKRSTESMAIALLKELSEILVFVHDRNVIHRDIKPANLIRRKADQKIVLIDFGAVKEIGGLAVDAQGNTNLTIAIGSPGYMPIEQVNGKPRFCSDIYAVGIMLIQALTGSEPRLLGEHPETAELVWRNHLQGNYSPQFLDILDKMVRYDFRQRYQTAAEVLEAIAALPGVDEHDLPTIIHGHTNNADGSDSSTIITTPQAETRVDVTTNSQNPPDVSKLQPSKLHPSNVIETCKNKRHSWQKFLIIGGSIAAISVIVAIVKSNPTPTKPEVATSGFPVPSPPTINTAPKIPIVPPSPPISVPPIPTPPIPTPPISVPPIPTPPIPVKSSEEILTQAILLTRNNKNQEALVKIDEAIAIDPRNADAWAAKGFVLAKLDRDTEASEAYQKALAIRPDFPVARQQYRALVIKNPKLRK